MHLSSEFRKAFPWSLLWHPGFRRAGELIYSYTWHLGWIWPFMFTAGALLFTPFDQVLSQNPLMWRSFSSTDPLMIYMHATNSSWAGFSNHHTVNLMLEGGLSFLLAWSFARKTRTPIWRWGILASYGAFLVWAVHEGFWWITYAAIWRPDLMVFSGFGELLCFVILIFTPTLGLYNPKTFIFWMFLFQFWWVIFGFPITESYKGDTPLYSNIWANLWEVASWAWGCAWFFLAERSDLLRWYQRVSALSLRHIYIKEVERSL